MQDCPFFLKVGVCRHGDECTKNHPVVTSSNTILIPNFYFYPAHDPASKMLKESIQEHLDLFYEDFFTELSVKYGPINQLIVCTNASDHLLGNLYITFKSRQDAIKCKEELSTRYYSGRRIVPQFCIVSNLEKAVCKQYDEGACTRGGFCNFIHRGKISKELEDELYRSQDLMYDR
ncbi:Splicing factor U2af 38 kDa subunit [Astathelohania contejeani]|uniref:Splicing factor U2af 38 kDa subunit n=1 Tax=Astathelohania contejeani TaxID=164912 RepID=A0ABQ7I103_9MICR|nr:Splicing factor U2af 38 kDa subunit [Thelohania contejeani]